MNKITIGVLTVSDRCSKKEAVDESGPCLMDMISKGIVKDGVVTKKALVPDKVEDIKDILIQWCNEGVDLILTTGGTGISRTDVTPEATAEVVGKTLPGISSLMFKKSSEVTPLAALSRGIAGVKNKTLIINFPGSKKASKECLEAVARVIPHAIDLITEKKNKTEKVHVELKAKKSSVVEDKPNPKTQASAYFCIDVKNAQKIITERVFLLMRENNVSTEEAVGYVLAQDVVALDSSPPFNSSLKDGYAVRSCDKGYSQFKVVGISNAGNFSPGVEVKKGTCVRISTGAAIPSGADAVVEVEQTRFYDFEPQYIELHKFPAEGQDILPLGSNFKMGELLLSSRTYIDGAASGLLAAAGIKEVRVFDKPLVGVLSTGDELIPFDGELATGQVRDSNKNTLLGLLSEEGFKAVDLGIARDEPETLRLSLERGFNLTDVVVTTGSMSMGNRDYLREILVADFNAEICFGRVMMKPGKPTSFGIVIFEGQPKLWFGLPGNPASVFVTSQLFLLPALRKISGLTKVFPKSVKALIKDTIHQENRPQYVRGELTYDGDEWHASVKKHQISSSIKTCVNTNCLVLIPAEVRNSDFQTPVKKDDRYEAFLIGKSFFRA